MTRCYDVSIRFKGLKWSLRAISTSSAALVESLMEEFGPGVFISIKRIELHAS